MAQDTPTLHASAVVIGREAVLIRGASGCGKSRLALGLLQAGERGLVRFARLLGDDRVEASAVHGRLILRPAATLAGLIEVRGIGIRRVPYEPVAAAGLVVDLGVADAERLPDAAERRTDVLGVGLRRLAVGPNTDPLSLVLALWQTGGVGSDVASAAGWLLGAHLAFAPESLI